jgi:hypothetical protein
MELQILSDESLQRINQKLSRLVELQNAQIDFNDPDIENAEKQAMQYVEARRAGRSGKTETESDNAIRNGVRDFLKKRSCYKTEKETRDLSITYPQF